MADSSGASELPWAVPLFPLPNIVVVSARRVAAAHSLKDRYRKMTADVLEDPSTDRDGLAEEGVGKGLLRAAGSGAGGLCGDDSFARAAAGWAVQFLLQGQARARLVDEVGKEPYRQGRLEPLQESEALENGSVGRARSSDRIVRSRRLWCAAGSETDPENACGRAAEHRTLRTLRRQACFPTSKLPFKQSLLSESNVRQRVWRVVEAIAALRPTWQNIPDDAGMN